MCRATKHLDELDTHLFTKDGTPNWRIRNSGCGWKLEDDFDGNLPRTVWTPRAMTFTGDDCSACTGSCQKEEALTTDETGVSGCSLALGSYDGETFVAA